MYSSYLSAVLTLVSDLLPDLDAGGIDGTKVGVPIGQRPLACFDDALRPFDGTRPAGAFLAGNLEHELARVPARFRNDSGIGRIEPDVCRIKFRAA